MLPARELTSLDFDLVEIVSRLVLLSRVLVRQALTRWSLLLRSQLSRRLLLLLLLLLIHLDGRRRTLDWLFLNFFALLIGFGRAGPLGLLQRQLTCLNF